MTNDYNEYAKKLIGTTKTMNCGLKATVIAYRGCRDIDIQFEDGTVRKHTSIQHFKKGMILPNPQNSKTENIKKYTGMTRIMKCGMKATIVKYKYARDIDIQFEDGTIQKHRSIYDFELGKISHKRRDSATSEENKDQYVGMTRTMNCGMKATIITYRKYTDIDVQFEDGTIREHVSLISFKRHNIMCESYAQRLLNEKYLGKTRMMNCGLNATVIACRDASDIDVQFEDGTVRKHIRADCFVATHIAHPTNVLFDTYKLNKAAFVFHDKTYFYVTYTENDSEILDVMCVDDMKQKLPLLTNPNNPKI